MLDSAGRKVLLGVMTGALLSTSVTTLVWAANDGKETHHLLDSSGKPVLTSRQKECVQTPPTPNEPPKIFEECGDISDRDKDGVPDDKDNCPDNTPQEISKGVYGDKNHPGDFADKTGCPIDTDGDGVPDYRDQCPNTPPDEIRCVDENGCTKDSDGDGVNDCKDKCPNSKPGAKVNADGCEAGGIERCTVITLASDVTFGFDKFELTPQARMALDQLEPQILSSLNAGTIDIVSVVGHTDSVGTDQYNQKLSEKRANSVRTYLVSKGIPSNKIVAIGKGEKEPVANNKTKEGRAQNRRVEIRFDAVSSGGASQGKPCTEEQRRKALGTTQSPTFVE